MSSVFLRTVEDFACGHCGAKVAGNGYTNHCPHCLWSKHVDVHPGDRAAACGGLMHPAGAELQGGEITLIHHCTFCGHRKRNRAEDDDNIDELSRLSAHPF